ncbi:Vacuolar protein sorting-associated protein ist1 [Lecanora helva]
MAPSSSIVSKIKVQLKLAISRLRMVQQKDTAIAKQQRRAMAQLLEQGKEESARIRVENIIRSDITTELYEVLELYCELLLARTGLMEAKECDPGLEEAIKSLIYAAPRTEVKELQQARALLVEKYGKDFAMVAMDNSDGKVAERVLKKLRVEPPEPELVTLYLKEIARTYGVDWPKGEKQLENDGDDEDEDNPSGGQAEKNLEEPLTTEELSKATPPRDLGPRSPVSVAPPSPSIDNLNPKVKLPGPPELKPGAKINGLKKQTPSTSAQSTVKDGDSGVGSGKKDAVGGKIPDVDELAERFAALKK